MNRSTSANISDMITQAFGSDCVIVPITSILPVKAIEKTTKSSHKYRQIAASIREIGLIEPPVVIQTPATPTLTYFSMATCASRC